MNRFPISCMEPNAPISLNSLIDGLFSDWDDSFFDFSRLGKRLTTSMTSSIYPPTDIYIAPDKSYCIDLACAGFSKDDISVTAGQNYVLIEIGKSRSEPDEGRKYISRGIKYASAEQKVYVDSRYYDTKNAQVSFDGGLLKISIPYEDAGYETEIDRLNKEYHEKLDKMRQKQNEYLKGRLDSSETKRLEL